jgi:hypothetical protein
MKIISHFDEENAKRLKVDVNYNNNLSNDNEEVSKNGFNHQLDQSTLNIPGANDSLLKQIMGYINQKYPDLQNRVEMIKEKWKEFKKRIPFKSPEMNTEITSENPNRIHQLFPIAVNASAVQQPSSANTTSPLFLSIVPLGLYLTGNIFTDRKSNLHPAIRAHSDEILVYSWFQGVERVFKTQVRQSLLELNE